MGARAKRKGSTGEQNPQRRNGKAWKRGLNPEARALEAQAKSAFKAGRKARKYLGMMQTAIIFQKEDSDV